MDIQDRQGRANSKHPRCNRLSAVLWLFLLFLSPPFCVMAQAQEQALESTPESELVAAEELVEVTVSLPDSQQMAVALTTPGLRESVLLDLTAVANVLRRAGDELEVDHAALAQNFLDDRAWLQMLVDRFGWVQPRSGVLDPAAWLVLKELQQHDLEDVALVFPGRAPETVLLYQVFQRAAQRLAIANLPILLLEVEADAITLWEAFLQLTGTQNSPDAFRNYYTMLVDNPFNLGLPRTVRLGLKLDF